MLLAGAVAEPPGDHLPVGNGLDVEGERLAGQIFPLSQAAPLSLPGPPTQRSFPFAPISLSLPASPKSRSLPAPPLSLSLPLPPQIRSLPARPTSWSSPPLPTITSAALVP